MNAKVEHPQSKMDSLKWGLVLILFVSGVVANYYYGHVPLPIRLIGWLILTCMMIGVAALTAKGRSMRSFAKEARIELRKVVWPTKQETVQTTIIVAVIIMVMALVLWGIDSVLLWAVTMLTGQRG